MKQLFKIVIAAILVFTMNLSFTLQGQGLPQDHSRWIGDIEGLVVDEQASALVYEFKFFDNGQVVINKHTKHDKLKQSFDWKMKGSDILVSGDSNGPVGELSGIVLTQVNDTEYTFKYMDEETEVKLKKSKWTISWLHILFLFALLFFGNELARRYKWAPYLMFFLLPIVLTPIWLESGLGWFRIIKVYSALAGAIFFTLYRFNFGLKNMNWPKVIIALILAVNIFEACTQDWSQPFLANKLNAFAGILNLITIYLWATIKVDEKKPHDMLWPAMTVGWIIAYDLWNVTFVYLNFPNTVSYTLFAVILAPTIAALFVKKGTWLQARAYTLSIYMMYICSSYMFNFDVTLVEPLPRNLTIVWILVIASVAWNVIYAVLHFRYRFTGKAPQNLEIGQSQSVID